MGYTNLFERGCIGGLEIKNRIVMPAMGCSLAASTGDASPEIIRYYQERARGGAGLIITEITRVDDETGGLVENEDVVVFKEDVQRDVLRLRLRRYGRWDRDVERVRLLHLLAGLQHDFAVDLHKPRFDESLEPGTGEVRVQGRQPYVKSFAHQNCQALW